MNATVDTVQVTITDELLEYAELQNGQLINRLKRKIVSSAIALLAIVLLAFALTFDATESRISDPVIVDAEGNTRVIKPILNHENSLTFSAKLADKYAMRLMNFHFLHLEEQMQSRRALFVDDDTYTRVYQRPLQDAGAFARILKNNYIITAATVRNVDLMGEFIDGGHSFIRYRIRMIQTSQGPSGNPESNPMTLTITFQRVSRDKAIEGLQISDLGTIR